MKRIIIVCIIIDIAIISTFSYFIFLKGNNNEIKNMIDVVLLDKDEATKLLDDYELEFIYTESLNVRDSIVSTEPKVNEFIENGQKIKIYLSTGEVSIYYEKLINTYYEDKIDYLNELEKSGVNIVIEHQISNDYPDGVIIFQSLSDKINLNDTLKLIVNYKEPLIFIPDFTGKTESFVLNYFKGYDIQINFIYNKKDGDFLVYNQSISAGSLVINSTVLYLYISI